MEHTFLLEHFFMTILFLNPEVVLLEHFFIESFHITYLLTISFHNTVS